MNPTLGGRPREPLVAADRPQAERERDAAKPEDGSPPPAVSPRGLYYGQCLSNTTKSFSAPMAFASLLPPPFRWAGTLASSQVFAHVRQQPPSTGMVPPPSLSDQRIATFIGFAPFIPAFGAQGFLTLRAGNNPDSPIGRLALKTAGLFDDSARMLPF